MKRMLFLSTQLPYPPQSGGVIKSWRLIEFFAQHFELTLLCLLKNSDEENVENFKDKLTNVNLYVYPCHVDRALKPLINSYISNKTLNVFRNYNEGAEKKAISLANNQDIIFVDHYEMFQYVPKSSKCKVILHEHNAEHKLWERFAELEDNVLKKAVLVQEARRIKNAEKNYCQKADVILAAPADITSLSSLGISKSKFYETYHLGDDNLLDLPALKFSKEKNRLLFVGTLSWEANVDGLIHFLENTFPLILQVRPDTHLDIIGRKPSLKLQKTVEKYQINVSLKGFVEDLEPYFERSAAFILPLRFGSGMKVKFINAMYRGIPVVTSPIGAESIDVEHNKSALIADRDQEFANYCIQLMDKRDLWEAISANSRKTAYEKYRWNAHLSNLKEYILA